MLLYVSYVRCALYTVYTCMYAYTSVTSKFYSIDCVHLHACMCSFIFNFVVNLQVMTLSKFNDRLCNFPNAYFEDRPHKISAASLTKGILGQTGILNDMLFTWHCACNCLLICLILIGTVTSKMARSPITECI